MADVIVPDADPNRHWTDIDITPIAEWFTAKFLLAGIIGGTMFALFMVRFFFTMRRALRPKTSGGFSGMGLN